MSLSKSRFKEGALFLLPFLFISLFLFFPLSIIIHEGFTNSQGSLTLDNFLNLLGSSYYRRVIRFTFTQSLFSTLFALLLGFPGAYILSHLRFPGKAALRALTTVPFVLPPILVILGFVIFFGNSGVINQLAMKIFGLSQPPFKILYSMQAIILAHGFYNFPIAMRLLSSSWERVSPGSLEAGKILGAGRIKLFLTVTLPQILPGIVAAAALIFLFCFMSFAIILVLGGGPRYTTMEVEIYRLAKMVHDLKSASALALLSTVFSALWLYVYVKFQHAQAMQVEEPGAFTPSLRPLKGGNRVWLFLYLLLIFFIALGPLFSVIINSLQRRLGWGGEVHFSLHWYKQLFNGLGANGFGFALRSIYNSLLFAALTVLFSLPLGTLLSYLIVRGRFFSKKFLELFLMLPMAISAVVLGLGYLKGLKTLGLAEGSWLLIVLAHTIITYPFVIRSVSAVFKKIPLTMVEAAQGLGASAWKVFRTVELPLIRSGLVTGATFAFAISVGELNATLMLAPPGITTIPLALQRLIGSYQFFSACVMGTILMVLCFFAFLIIDKIGEYR